MTERISLVEAYDNRDVIAQLVRLRDNVDELLNILKDIDPNGDLTNVVTKTGDQTIDGVKRFIGQIVADCDIIQNGSAYETHAEQVFTKNDLIVTREDAIGGIAAGQLSGIRVKKYDGVSDLNLGVDSGGMMRVGDVGSEQPLATREEAANMTSGALVKWDGVNNRMIAPASNAGDDLKPIKIVNGEPVAVANNLVSTVDDQTVSGTKIFTNLQVSKDHSSGIIVKRDTTIAGPDSNNIVLTAVDDNAQFLANLWVRKESSGRCILYVTLRNNDGTQKTIELGRGD